MEVFQIQRISSRSWFQAQNKAEQMSASSGQELHIVGWYHSHPHITVWPSDIGKWLFEAVDGIPSFRLDICSCCFSFSIDDSIFLSHIHAHTLSLTFLCTNSLSHALSHSHICTRVFQELWLWNVMFSSGNNSVYFSFSKITKFIKIK